MPEYPQELIDRLVLYIRTSRGVELTDEDAVRHLDSLAEVYDCYQTLAQKAHEER